jgi:flagella basal body P-ring formation protein FlgA
MSPPRVRSLPLIALGALAMLAVSLIAAPARASAWVPTVSIEQDSAPASVSASVPGPADATSSKASANVSANAPADAAADAPTEAVRRFVAEELAREHPELRAQITVGDIDPHLHLAPCAHTEVFLRAGSRLWGRSFVGYRCLQRPGWSISIPVAVRLFGPALVATQALAPMQAIAPASLRREEIEVTREPGGVVVDAAQVEDRVCGRPIESGQAIPLSCLRTVPAVGQGEAVKLLGIGSGFTISTEGIALATVAPGESVRVRTDSGHTVSGIARKGRVVEVSF